MTNPSRGADSASREGFAVLVAGLLRPVGRQLCQLCQLLTIVDTMWAAWASHCA